MKNTLNHKKVAPIHVILSLLVLLTSLFFNSCQVASVENETITSPLFSAGINLIPYPQEVTMEGEKFVTGDKLSIVLDDNATEKDKFAAELLSEQLSEEWNIESEITQTPSEKGISLTRKTIPKKITDLPDKKIRTRV